MTPRYRINDIVYHAVDEDPGIVTAIIYRESTITYEVTWQGRCSDEHSAGELSKHRSFLVQQKDDDGKAVT